MYISRATKTFHHFSCITAVLREIYSHFEGRISVIRSTNNKILTFNIRTKFWFRVKCTLGLNYTSFLAYSMANFFLFEFLQVEASTRRIQIRPFQAIRICCE